MIAPASKDGSWADRLVLADGLPSIGETAVAVRRAPAAPHRLQAAQDNAAAAAIIRPAGKIPAANGQKYPSTRWGKTKNAV